MAANESELLPSDLLLVNTSEPEDALIVDLLKRVYRKDWLLMPVAEGDRLLEVHRCPICHCDPIMAQMCPACDRDICDICLRSAYEVDGDSCPHCR